MRLLEMFPIEMAAVLLISAFLSVPIVGWGAMVAIIIAIGLAVCIISQL